MVSIRPITSTLMTVPGLVGRWVPYRNPRYLPTTGKGRLPTTHQCLPTGFHAQMGGFRVTGYPLPTGLPTVRNDHVPTRLPTQHDQRSGVRFLLWPVRSLASHRTAIYLPRKNFPHRFFSAALSDDRPVIKSLSPRGGLGGLTFSVACLVTRQSRAFLYIQEIRGMLILVESDQIERKYGSE